MSSVERFAGAVRDQQDVDVILHGKMNHYSAGNKSIHCS